MKQIVLAITGASGAIYTDVFMQKMYQLRSQYKKLDLVISETGMAVWQHEREKALPEYSGRQYDENDFYAPFASGSSVCDTMIIMPCTMGTLGKIANGIADNLIARAADVVLKEKKQLILVPRETPYNLIHVENMKKLILAGAEIIPANPGFYAKPDSLESLAGHFCDRIIDRIGLNHDGFRW